MLQTLAPATLLFAILLSPTFANAAPRSVPADHASAVARAHHRARNHRRHLRRRRHHRRAVKVVHTESY
jgi:hypothetical protein